MSGFPAAEFVAALPVTGAAIAGVALVTFLVGVRIGRHNVADTAWGLLFIAAAVAATAVAVAGGTGDAVRGWLLVVMVAIWGVRLAVHTGRRSIGKGEDRRYETMLSGPASATTVNAVLKIYLPQAVLAFLISMPLQVGAFVTDPVGLLGAAGVGLWALGMFFETVGDAQLERYKAWKKAQPADAVEASVMDKGLWRYTRHPNYFGDACVWWGIFLITAEHWPGPLTVVAPALMTYLLAAGSGKKTLERAMAKRPGYPEYMRRTSGFVPLPPRRRPEGPPAREPDPAAISLLRRT